MLNTRPASPVEFLARKKETPPCAMTKIRTCARKSTPWQGKSKGQGRVPGYCSPKGSIKGQNGDKGKGKGKGPKQNGKMVSGRVLPMQRIWSPTTLLSKVEPTSQYFQHGRGTTTQQQIDQRLGRARWQRTGGTSLDLWSRRRNPSSCTIGSQGLSMMTRFRTWSQQPLAFCRTMSTINTSARKITRYWRRP